MQYDLEPGNFVKHPKERNWGIGQVQSIIKNKATVNFQESGKKVINLDNIELEKMNDDNEATISSRLNVYHDQTEPLIEFYCSRNLLKTLDADGEIQDIYTRLLALLGYV